MAPPLILLHGALGSTDQFSSITPLLKGDCDVHTFNFSGHGGLPIEAPFTIAALAQQLHDYIQTHRLERPNVFGYSMGGYVALHCAAYHPNYIGRIMTLGTKMKWDAAIAANEIKMLNPDIIEQKVPAFAETLRKRHAPTDWKKQMTATASMMTGLGNGTALTADQLHQIHIPINLTLGESDQMVSREETEWAAAQLPNAQMKIIPGWKHPIETIDPVQLSDLIKHHFITTTTLS
jgi:pimeloyl-ACP methyl ester carboxylesterase